MTELVEQAVLQRDEQIGTQVVDGILLVALAVNLHKDVVDAVLQQFLVGCELQPVVEEHVDIHVV